MDRELWDLYLKAIHNAGIGDIKAWTKLNLTMPQLKVLMLLNHSDNLTITQLAEDLSVSLPNMTGIIDRLVQQNLVKRVQSDKDRRVVFIRPTDNSRNIFIELNKSGYDHFKNIEKVLSENEIEIIKLGLKVLVQGMEQCKRIK